MPCRQTISTEDGLNLKVRTACRVENKTKVVSVFRNDSEAALSGLIVVEENR